MKRRFGLGIIALALAWAGGSADAPSVAEAQAPDAPLRLAEVPTSFPVAPPSVGPAGPVGPAGGVRIRLPLLAADGAGPRAISIAAVGDVSLARGLVPLLESEGADYPFRLVEGALRADITFANLEGVLSDRGSPWPKGYTFRTPPPLAHGLRAAGFTAVTIANNHSFDFGPDGLADTIATLDRLGIRHVGAGASLNAAQSPALVTANGLRIAFLGYVATPDEGNGFSITDWAAGSERAGVVIGTPEVVRAGVAAVRSQADFVIVAIHAGTEYSNQPDGTQRALANAALEAGADVVLGAHPHTVQPIERRGSQLIAWSLGNFVFDLDEVDLANIPPPRVSLVLRLKLTEGQGVTAVEVVPVTLDPVENRPRPATPQEAELLAGLTRLR